MLSLIYGTDQIKRAAARDAFIAIARKKFPNLEVSMRNALDMSREEIEADIYATDLFGAHRLVVIANLSLHEAVESLFPKLLQDVKDRQDLTVLVVEEKLLKPLLVKYEKYADSISCYDVPKKGDGTEKRNPFALSDAILTRDKKLSWKLYREAIDTGASEEEIAGMVFWSLKSLLLAAKESTAADAGLHPFVYGKAKRALLKWPETELANALSYIVALVHEDRNRGYDSEVSLEQFILTRI